uniref:DNA-directed RNA polymerase subunit Rpo4 n=1 Tax=Ignisphaera aggregans TaxID=334771 RepID=A0A7C4JJJ1_9CREN
MYDFHWWCFLPYQIVDYRDIPNPIAKKILEEYLSKIRSYDISVELAKSALEYLQLLRTLCDPNKSEILMNKLREEFKLRDTTIALIINIVPRTIDELRMLLAFETSVPEEDIQQRILEIVKEYCG